MSRRRLHNGPNWADTLIKKYREPLGVPEGRPAVPIPYDPDFNRTWGRRAGYMAYGSGFYGAVYPTRRPGVVLKLTRDESEAYFSKVAMDLSDKPAGMVRFYEVRELPSRGVPAPSRNGPGSWTESLGDKGVWAIWREDVPDLGFGALMPGAALEHMTKRERQCFEKAWRAQYDRTSMAFRIYVAAAHLLRENLLNGRHGDPDRAAVLGADAPIAKAEAFVGRYVKPTPAVPMLPSPLKELTRKRRGSSKAANPLAMLAFGAWAAAMFYLWKSEGDERKEQEARETQAAGQMEDRIVALVDGRPSSAEAGAMALALARAAAERIAEGPMDTVGTAILFYMDRGIVLADVHTNNVGFVVRGNQARAVITDPGHAVFVTDRYDDVEIADLVPRRDQNPRAMKRRLMRR